MSWSWMALPAFPLASHLAATEHSSLGAALAIGLPLLPWLLGKPEATPPTSLAKWATTAALLAGAAWSGFSLVLLASIPVLLPFGLMLLFARSLLPGHVAVVSRIAETIDGALSAKALRYTRNVTIVWVMLFAALGLEGFWLALYAPVGMWSLFTNGLNYAALAAAFLIEFMLRRHILRDEAPHDAVAFIRKLSKVRMADMWSHKT